MSWTVKYSERNGRSVFALIGGGEIAGNGVCGYRVVQSEQCGR